MALFRRDRPDWHALAELVRVPNLPTAMADSLMGALFVSADRSTGGWPAVALVAAASALLYAGGAALGDVFDVAEDARRRPGRPIPSRRVSLPMARLVGVELLLLGSTAAWFAAFFVGSLWPGITAILLIAAIAAYSGGLKRTFLGPAAMGSCRALNVLLGVGTAAHSAPAAVWLVAAAVGVYTAGISLFARTEETTSRRRSLLAAGAIMLAGPGLLACLPLTDAPLIPTLAAEPGRWVVLMVILALMISWRCLRAVSDPRPMLVQVTVAYAIMTLVVLDAAAAFAVRDIWAAVAILALLMPTILLAQRFKAT